MQSLLFLKVIQQSLKTVHFPIFNFKRNLELRRKCLNFLTVKNFFLKIAESFLMLFELHTFGLKITLKTILYVGKLWVQLETELTEFSGK